MSSDRGNTVVNETLVVAATEVEERETGGGFVAIGNLLMMNNDISRIENYPAWNHPIGHHLILVNLPFKNMTGAVM